MVFRSALLTLQLAPSEERDWQIDDFAGSLAWQPLHHGQGARIEKLELVDWSVRLPGDRALDRRSTPVNHRRRSPGSTAGIDLR